SSHPRSEVSSTELPVPELPIPGAELDRPKLLVDASGIMPRFWPSIKLKRPLESVRPSWKTRKPQTRSMMTRSVGTVPSFRGARPDGKIGRGCGGRVWVGELLRLLGAVGLGLVGVGVLVPPPPVEGGAGVDVPPPEAPPPFC